MSRSLFAALPLLLGAGAACEADKATGTARERVNAVAAAPQAQPGAAEAFCDVVPPASAPPFAWPTLDTPPPQVPPGKWLWVNLWATWCKPCVGELPQLTAWGKRLADKMDLQFVSTDASTEDIARYRAANPGAPTSLRVADPDAVSDTLAKLGVPGASLPVHIFVDPSGRVRCVRASSLEAHDLPAIRALLGAR